MIPAVGNVPRLVFPPGSGASRNEAKQEHCKDDAPTLTRGSEHPCDHGPGPLEIVIGAASNSARRIEIVP